MLQIKTALERVKRRQKRELELWDEANSNSSADMRLALDKAAGEPGTVPEGDDPDLLLAMMGGGDEDMGEEV